MLLYYLLQMESSRVDEKGNNSSKTVQYQILKIDSLLLFMYLQSLSCKYPMQLAIEKIWCLRLLFLLI